MRVALLVSAVVCVSALVREPSRRTALKLLTTNVAVAVASATAAGAAELKLGECRTSGNALFLTKTCNRTGLGPSDSEPRLRACVPAENCVSTSAIKSPSQYSSPWSYSPSTTDATVAFEELVAAIENPRSGLTLVTVDRERLYARATAPTTVTGATSSNVDDLEFRIDAAKEFVFYRSASRDAVFFFPPQNLYSVPLSDGGTNRARLEALRVKLGWESLGPRSEELDDSPRQYAPLKR